MVYNHTESLPLNNHMCDQQIPIKHKPGSEGLGVCITFAIKVSVFNLISLKINLTMNIKELTFQRS